MKKLLGVACVAFVVGILCTVPMMAQEKTMEKEATITGEVVEVGCYMQNGAKGEGHLRCAKTCAEAGGALGILTADGKLYVSLRPEDRKTSPNALLMDHIAMNVEAKGLVIVKGGTQGMVIKSVAMAKPMK